MENIDAAIVFVLKKNVDNDTTEKKIELLFLFDIKSAKFFF